jgi:hypothetical protein
MGEHLAGWTPASPFMGVGDGCSCWSAAGLPWTAAWEHGAPVTPATVLSSTPPEFDCDQSACFGTSVGDNYTRYCAAAGSGDVGAGQYAALLAEGVYSRIHANCSAPPSVSAGHRHSDDAAQPDILSDGLQEDIERRAQTTECDAALMARSVALGQQPRALLTSSSRFERSSSLLANRTSRTPLITLINFCTASLDPADDFLEHALQGFICSAYWAVFFGAISLVVLTYGFGEFIWPFLPAHCQTVAHLLARIDAHRLLNLWLQWNQWWQQRQRRWRQSRAGLAKTRQKALQEVELVHMPAGPLGRRLLHVAAEVGNYQTVRMLLSTWPVDTLSTSGVYENELPVLLAQRCGARSTVRLLAHHDDGIRVLPALQRLAWASAAHRRLGGGSTVFYLLSHDLLHAVGTVPSLLSARYRPCRQPYSYTQRKRRHRARKRHFLRHLYIKTNILPRQARDKHRENSKTMPFSQVRTFRSTRDSWTRNMRRWRQWHRLDSRCARISNAAAG